MAAILSRHNKTILASKNTNVNPPCNCRRKVECPLNGDCRKKAIVYKASISTDSNDPPKSYYGCCKTEFKSRFYNHRQTFKNKQKRYITELSKAFWKAIDNGREPLLNGAFRPDLVPTNPVPPGIISASMKSWPFSWQTHLAHLTKERNSPASVAIKTNLN